LIKSNYIAFLIKHRDTASKYLKATAKIGILNSIQIKNTRFFVNIKLLSFLKKVIYNIYTEETEKNRHRFQSILKKQKKTFKQIIAFLIKHNYIFN